MLRFILLSLLLTLLVRAIGRLFDAFMQGLRGDVTPRRGAGVPQRGVQMARDPVCGTFVVPDNALMVSDGARRLYFCSSRCRDQYRARTA
jgi:YHS domain-containing protein